MHVMTAKTIFFHFPKCGGTFVRNMLSQCAEGFTMTAPVSAFGHLPPSVANITSDKLKFTFLREPVSWYASQYLSRRRAFRRSLVSRYSIGFDDSFFRTFSEFVKEATKKYPGFLSTLYLDYFQGCQAVGRMENLRKDLIAILKRAGETYSEKLILTSPKLNVKEREVTVTNEDTKRIIEAEPGAVEVYAKLVKGDHVTKE